jgi:hypothetical protein
VRRHELDLTSLVSGVIFMGIGAAFLVDLVVDVALDPRWLAPFVLIGIGLAGLLSSMPVHRPVAADSGVEGKDEDDAPVEDPLTPR